MLIRLFMVCVFALCLTLPVTSFGATFVQAKACSNAGVTSDTFTCAFGSNTTTGNVIVGFGGFHVATTPATVALTDSQSNTYTTKQSYMASPFAGAGGIAAVAPVTTGGATTVTMTTTSAAAPQRHALCVMEFSGVNTTTPVDVSAKNTQATPTTSTDAVTSTAAVSTADGEMIVGGEVDIEGLGQSTTAGTGFTLGDRTTTNLTTLCEYLAQTSQGSIAATFTASSTGDDTIAFMVALKNAAAGACRGGLSLLGVGGC